MTPASTPSFDKSRLAARSVRCVAVIGAECTGKTSLCQTLSQRLPGIAFTEPLRLWVEEKGTPPGARAAAGIAHYAAAGRGEGSTAGAHLGTVLGTL